MAGLILDASVVVAAYLPDEEWSDRALAVIAGVLDQRAGNLVPMTCWLEVAQALVRATRRGRLPMSAVEAAEDSLAGLIEHVPGRDVSAVESMRVALDLGLGVYDSSYLVLSRATEQPLITADRSLFDIGLRAGHDMVWLGDLAID